MYVLEVHKMNAQMRFTACLWCPQEVVWSIEFWFVLIQYHPK